MVDGFEIGTTEGSVIQVIRNCVRSSADIVYVTIIERSPDDELRMFKGNMAGVPTSFSQVGPNITLPDGNFSSMTNCCMGMDGTTIHVVYYNVGVGADRTFNYVSFDTITDTWGVPEVIAVILGNPNKNHIDVDQNGDLHVVWNSFESLTQRPMYSNNISGSWKTPLQIIPTSETDNIAQNVMGIMIATPLNSVGEDRPIILMDAGRNNSINNRIFYGNDIDATSFTTSENLDWGKFRGTMSFAIDKFGVITAACNSDSTGINGVSSMRHFPANDWDTWSFDQFQPGSGFTAPSLFLTAFGNVYVVLETGSAFILWKLEDGSTTYVQETVKLPFDPFMDAGGSSRRPHVRWQHYFMVNPTRLDIIWGKTSNEVFYNGDLQVLLYQSFDGHHSNLPQHYF